MAQTVNYLTEHGLLGYDELATKTATATTRFNMLYGTNITSLTPTITASSNATVSPTTAQDFTNPVVYTVTAGNGSKIGASVQSNV